MTWNCVEDFAQEASIPGNFSGLGRCSDLANQTKWAGFGEFVLGVFGKFSFRFFVGAGRWDFLKTKGR